MTPLVADTDADGISDYEEVGYDGDYGNYNPSPGGGDINANEHDTDADGYTDYMEIFYQTDGSFESESKALGHSR